METAAKKNLLKRMIIYILGLMILAVGITLNTKVTLGVSPIISTAYCASEIWSFDFGDSTLVLYILLVLIQVVLHFIMHRQKRLSAPFPTMMIRDGLQILVSIIFTRFLNVLSAIIPIFAEKYKSTFLGTLTSRLLFLAIAIICTGIGAAMSLTARIIPNPGDGIVQAVSDFIKKPVGFIKNCVDITCVFTTCCLSLVFTQKIIGIGIGTVCAMIFTGRVMAVYVKLTQKQKS